MTHGGRAELAHAGGLVAVRAELRGKDEQAARVRELRATELSSTPVSITPPTKLDALLYLVLRLLDPDHLGYPLGALRCELAVLSDEAFRALLDDAARRGIIYLEPRERPAYIRLVTLPIRPPERRARSRRAAATSRTGSSPAASPARNQGGRNRPRTRR
ncbi:hypothetical protein [Sorangium sp. So ce128]|uniref:hypothetical protein n=1 Tax=Sorangium sp. So ce128 TaxID=3133281 RepID=UPI003F5D63D6